MNQLVPISSSTLPALVAAAGERASMRFLEFFAANIRNPHTRRAYYRAAEKFLSWCASAGVPSILAVQPVHVATWIEVSTRELASPSVKQRLAALRHLFDWLVNGQVVPINPGHTVRGPRRVVTSGQTPVLDPAEARALLDSIIDTGDHPNSFQFFNAFLLRVNPAPVLYRDPYLPVSSIACAPLRKGRRISTGSRMLSRRQLCCALCGGRRVTRAEDSLSLAVKHDISCRPPNRGAPLLLFPYRHPEHGKQVPRKSRFQSDLGIFELRA
jgi:hypothetical protein